MRLTDGGRSARAGRRFSRWEPDSERLGALGGACTTMGPALPRAAKTFDSRDLGGAVTIAQDRFRGPMIASSLAARSPGAADDR
jgi:hypothetical protein